MTEVKEVEIKKTKNSDLFLVDPRNIVIVDDFNVRKDMGDMDGLMLSIIANGQLEPITCKKVRNSDTYELIEGHRRMKAINMAIEAGHDIPFVKVLGFSGNDEDRIFAMVITGIGKKALTILEEAEAYKRLINHSYEVKEIAGRVGKSVPHVYNLLRLVEAPKTVKNAIERGDITTTTVMKLIREVETPEQLISTIENAIAKNGNSEKKVKIKANDVLVKSKSPMVKLNEAYEIAEANGAKNLDLLYHLTIELGNKECTPESIANLFN